MNRLQALHSRLATRYETRHAELTVKAEQAANRIERIYHRHWRQVLVAVRGAKTVAQLYQRVRYVFTSMHLDLRRMVPQTLGSIARWTIRKTDAALREAMRRKVMREDVEPNILTNLPDNQVLASVYGGEWRSRFERLSQLAPPEDLAQAVAQGAMSGETPRAIARRIQPMVNGNRSSARRIARTEARRISHNAQMARHEALGPMLRGYQIRAVLDQNTRPHHANRNGLVWYKDSGRDMFEVLRMDRSWGGLPDDHN